MKINIISISLLLLSINSVAQKFNLNDLMKLMPMNWNEFDTYLTAKGYTFSSSDNYCHSYEFNKSKLYDGHYMSERHIYKPASATFIGYHTIHNEEYISFKNQIKQEHFIYIKSYEDKVNNALIFEYENIWYKVVLTTDKNKADDNGEDLDGERYGVRIIKK